MAAKRKLKNALSAIDDAVTKLRRARNSTENDDEIRRAMSDLDDAETLIKRAIRDLPDD